MKHQSKIFIPMDDISSTVTIKSDNQENSNVSSFSSPVSSLSSTFSSFFSKFNLDGELYFVFVQVSNVNPISISITLANSSHVLYVDNVSLTELKPPSLTINATTYKNYLLNGLKQQDKHESPEYEYQLDLSSDLSSNSREKNKKHLNNQNNDKKLSEFFLYKHFVTPNARVPVCIAKFQLNYFHRDNDHPLSMEFISHYRYNSFSLVTSLCKWIRIIRFNTDVKRQRISEQEEELKKLSNILNDTTYDPINIKKRMIEEFLPRINGEKAKIRDIRAKRDEMLARIESLQPKATTIAADDSSESTSDEEEKEERKENISLNTIDGVEEKDFGNNNIEFLAEAPSSSLLQSTPSLSFNFSPSIEQIITQSDTQPSNSSNSSQYLDKSTNITEVPQTRPEPRPRAQPSIRKRARASEYLTIIPTFNSNSSSIDTEQDSLSQSRDDQLNTMRSTSNDEVILQKPIQNPLNATTAGLKRTSRSKSRLGATAMLDDLA